MRHPIPSLFLPTSRRCPFLVLLITVAVTVGNASVTRAQSVPSAAPTEEAQREEKELRAKRAFALLEDVLNDAQMLKLPENRIRVQIGAADMLWANDESRARTLFRAAAEAIGEMIRSMSLNTGSDERQNFTQVRSSADLREQLILTTAQHDATLAYQLLAATRQQNIGAMDGRYRRAADMESSLEERLLSLVASLDPKLALQNAEQMLDQGEYPRSLPAVLAKLRATDKEAADRFEDRLLKRLNSENMLGKIDAGMLGISLLQAGPRIADANGAAAETQPKQSQVLGQGAYTQLMGTVIDWALKATPLAASNTTSRRGRGGFGSRAGAGSAPYSSAPTEAQNEQFAARRLLGSLQTLLPQIDLYLPSRAPAVRQKITEVGLRNDPRANFDQVMSLMQQGTSSSLLSAAGTAPPMMQSRIYQQAALKALDEGNIEQAKQIANEHLDTSSRERVLQTVTFRQVAQKAEADKLDDLKLQLAALKSDDDRVDLLVQLADILKKTDTKRALQLLEDARQMTNRRAANYQQLERQLKVARAFRELDPARSFDVLEPGIMQLNELLSAASVLSGFEVSVFRDGELPVQGLSPLANMVNRYGQELGALASSDFDRAQLLANRFQFAESRIMARLSIAKGMLGMELSGARDVNSRFRFFQQDQVWPN